MDQRLVILVEFELKPGAAEGFRRAIIENATASLRDEPGCRQFDVVEPEDGAGGRVVLYEVYDDAAAFEAHLRTPHYARFAEVNQPLVRSSRVHRLRFAEAGSPGKADQA